MKFNIAPLVLGIALSMQPVHAEDKSVNEQVLDKAQQVFVKLFPSSQTTQTFAPYVYRFYPSTGVYLGINLNNEGVYLLGGAFGNIPIYVDQVNNVLGLLNSRLENTNQNQICDTSNIPAGFTFNQEGNMTLISTNGQCVTLPANSNVCDTLPETDANNQPIETGIHVLSQNTVSKFEITGINFPGFDSIFKELANKKICVINAPTELTSHIIKADVCLDITNQLGELSAVPGIEPPVTTRFMSTSNAMTVDDCFATDAATITNLVTKEVWGNQNGSFVKIN